MSIKAASLSHSPASEGANDVKVKAVNEMMERIKHGVVLRPVKSQGSKVRKTETGQSWGLVGYSLQWFPFICK